MWPVVKRREAPAGPHSTPFRQRRPPVERTPGYRFGAAPFDPFLAKVGLAAGEEPQLRAHSCALVGDEPFEPAIVVAVPVAQNEATDPTRIEIEQLELPD